MVKKRILINFGNNAPSPKKCAYIDINMSRAIIIIISSYSKITVCF